MRTLLWVEVLTASLIVLVGIVVFVRVASGHAPAHQPFTLNMFTVPPGVGTSTLFLGIVFGFLSFAGFEAAATLGEEAANPRRAIPRAIFGVALFGGVFYAIGTAIEMLGFGTTTKGVAAFASSSSLFGTLGSEYVTPAVGDIVTLGTTIAAIGCCLATLVAAARLLFAMSRGGSATRRLSRVSAKSGVPAVAAAAIAVAAAAVILLILAVGTSVAFNLFAWSGTVGTLVLLVAYGIFTAGRGTTCASAARATASPRTGSISSCRSSGSWCSATRSTATSCPGPARRPAGSSPSSPSSGWPPPSRPSSPRPGGPGESVTGYPTMKAWSSVPGRSRRRWPKSRWTIPLPAGLSRCRYRSTTHGPTTG